MGCNQIYGLDETRLPPAPPDAPPPPGCSGGTFGAPQVVTTLDEGSEREFEPALRHDLLELWFARVGSVRDEVWVSRRASTDVPFEPPMLAPFSSNFDDGRPSITGDGLRVLFTSDRGGGNDVWEVVRPTLDAPFGTPRQVTGLGAANVLPFDISFDGLRIYFNDSNAIDDAVYMATRPSFDEPFDPAELVVMEGPYPAISPDELELFFNPIGTNQLRRYVRATKTDAFVGAPRLLLDSGDDPDLAADGRTLVIARSSALHLYTRDCP